MPVFTRGTTTFNYTSIGSGLPFVFLHGIGGGVRQPGKVLEPSPGVRLISFDARAHGATVWSGDPAELSFDTFGDDLIGLLNHLGVPRAVVGGISMGAGVALNAAVRYPERMAGLAFARPAWLDRPMPGNIIALFDLLSSVLRELNFSVTTAEGLDWAWRSLERNSTFARVARRYPHTAWSLRGQLTAQRAIDGVARLERVPRDRPVADLSEGTAIRVPTLVLAHREDPIHRIACGRRLAERIADARLVEVTPRSIDRKRHAIEVQHNIERFVGRISDTQDPELELDRVAA